MWKLKSDLIEVMTQKDCKRSLSAFFDTQRPDFVQKIVLLKCSHYIPGCFILWEGEGSWQVAACRLMVYLACCYLL